MRPIECARSQDLLGEPAIMTDRIRARRVARSTSLRTALLAGCSILALGMSAAIVRADDDGRFGSDHDSFGFARDRDDGRGDDDRRFDLKRDSLVISSTTYVKDKGAVATLAVGTPLAGTDTATVPAVADNNYVKIWNNAPVDGSFGVTSPIRLTDVEPYSGRVLG